MPRRPGGLSRLGLMLTAALAAAVTACQTDVGDAGCGSEPRGALPASPLSLLSRARLDRLGSGFALAGIDPDGKTVRWRSLDEAGAAGAEQQLGVSASPSGPWLAFTNATLLIGQGFAAANGADVELRVAAVPVGGAAALPPPGAVLATIPGALVGAASPDVAFGASRSGGHATLAWYDTKQAGVQTLTVTPAGAPVGQPKIIEPSTPASCLAFVPGRDAATVAFTRRPAGASGDPELIVVELDEAGAVSNTLQLQLTGHESAGCPQVRGTPTGYILAFDDAQGGWLGVYTASSRNLQLTSFSSAVSFPGGTHPPLVGLGPAPEGYAVIVQGRHGGELWRLDATGQRRPGTAYLPSVQGTTGEISTWTAPDGIFATYADYTAPDGGNGPEGQRFFVFTRCR